ncbi:hypothetical protein LJR230_002329 [Trinickia sp. LjRoot230]|uniref:hypothetical protein n=1 Tax=Trinickia sp. LjRoot230 TaxID=3342288 RepID=UPI003ED15ABB
MQQTITRIRQLHIELEWWIHVFLRRGALAANDEPVPAGRQSIEHRAFADLPPSLRSDVFPAASGAIKTASRFLVRIHAAMSRSS